MVLRANFADIRPYELVDFLLRETGQYERDAVNIEYFLDRLKLNYLPVNFDLFAENIKECGNPRALISFPERLIAVHTGMFKKRERFSTLHEIAHYVLPEHQNSLYLCDDEDLGFNARIVLEKEASEFAAELLFMGKKFILEANSERVTAKAVKRLAEKYDASFEATVRHIMKKYFHPCMLAIFEKPANQMDNDLQPKWVIKSCIPSKLFKTRYSSAFQGTLPSEIGIELLQPGRDIADSVSGHVVVTTADQSPLKCHAEFFSNTYNIFGLFVPE